MTPLSLLFKAFVLFLTLTSIAAAQIPTATASYSFDDLSTEVAIDGSGSGNNGLIVGATSNPGFVGTSLAFNGMQGSVEVPASAFTTVDAEITIAFWSFAGADQPREDTSFYAENSNGDPVLNINLPWSDLKAYWDAGYENGSKDGISVDTPDANSLAAWNHWVFTKNATTGEMKIYFNGDLYHEGSGYTKRITGITEASIGSQLDTLHYSGFLDEFQIYDKAMSAEQAEALFDSYFGDVLTITGEIEGLTARFQLYIPESVTEVKAAFYISQHGRGNITDPVLRQFAAEENVALLGFFGAAVQRGVGWNNNFPIESMDPFIQNLATLSGYPELPDVPIMTFGHSNGTGLATCWPRYRPEQVLCWTSFHPGFSEYLQFENLEFIPSMTFLGTVDSFFENARQDLIMQNMRSTRNAAVCVMAEGYTGHGMANPTETWSFIVEFCKAAMRNRLNDDGSLSPVDIESGWLGDTYEVSIVNPETLEGGRQELDIAPYAEYEPNGKGADADLSIANWFIDQEFAEQWQLYGMLPITDYLVNAPTSYNAWLIANSEILSDSSEENLKNYIFSGDQGEDFIQNEPQVAINGTDFQFRYRRRAESIESTSQMLQSSTDLINWNDAVQLSTESNLMDVMIGNQVDGMESVEVTVPTTINNDAKRFWRLELTPVE
ncbi:MAG: LamG domain-containing protein [Akkermansiaceae bacterium]